jgi:hypothetical protein
VNIRFSIPLFWRDAGKIAHGRFKSSGLLMGRIDQAIPTCVHYMRGPGPKWYEKNGRNREAAGIVQRPASLMTGGIYTSMSACATSSPDGTKWQGVAPNGSPVTLSMENAVCCVSNACP